MWIYLDTGARAMPHLWISTLSLLRPQKSGLRTSYQHLKRQAYGMGCTMRRHYTAAGWPPERTGTGGMEFDPG